MPVAADVRDDSSLSLRSGRALVRLRSSLATSTLVEQLTGMAPLNDRLMSALAGVGMFEAASEPGTVDLTDDLTAALPAGSSVRSVSHEDGLTVLSVVMDGIDGWVAACHVWSRLLLAAGPTQGPCPDCLRGRLRAAAGHYALPRLPLDELLGPASSRMNPLTHPRTAGAVSVSLSWLLRPRADGSGRVVDIRYQHRRPRVVPHQLLPRPGCGCNAAETPHPPPTSRTINRETLATARDRLMWTVSPLTGLVSRVAVGAIGPLAEARCVSSIRIGQDGGPTLAVGGAAVRDTALKAEATAMAEGAERYAAAIYPRSAVTYGTASLTMPTVEPADLVADPDDLLPFTHAGRNAEIGWLIGHRLGDGTPVLVPAVAVLLAYRRRATERFLQPISSGLAAGTDRDGAVRRGLLECVERDAWAVAWELRRAGARLDMSQSCCSRMRDAIAGVTQVGGYVWARDITSDVGVPVVVAGSISERGPRGQPLVAVGAKATWTIHDAMIGALYEVAQSQLAVAGFLTDSPPPSTVERVREMRDFYTFYCRRDRLAALEFLTNGPGGRQVDCSPGRALSTADLAARIARVAEQPLMVDLTPGDLGRAGVRVVRVVVPGLCRADYVVRGRPLRHPRILKFRGADRTRLDTWLPRPGG